MEIYSAKLRWSSWGMKMTSIFTILVKKKYNNAVSNIFALAQRALKGAGLWGCPKHVLKLKITHGLLTCLLVKCINSARFILQGRSHFTPVFLCSPCRLTPSKGKGRRVLSSFPWRISDPTQEEGQTEWWDYLPVSRSKYTPPSTGKRGRPLSVISLNRTVENARLIRNSQYFVLLWLLSPK